MKISIVGSGSFGTALAIMLADMGHEVCLWSFSRDECADLIKHKENRAFLPKFSIPSNVKHTTHIRECANSDIVVCALPSFAVRNVLNRLEPYVNSGQVLLNVSKGLETDTLLTLSTVISDVLPCCDVAVMSGPSHAEEVAAKLPTTNVVAAKSLKTAHFIQDAFMNPYFRVYTHDDMLGVELGGAIKNVIALCAGISDGLGFGDNTKAALMTRGMYEITKLGTAMGARAKTFSGLTGIGDLIVTCTSRHSRNRRAGILIGQGKTTNQVQEEIKMVIEGINTCRATKHLSDKMNVEMPITQEAYAVLFENKPAREATISLMQRDKKHESEEGFLGI